VKAVEVKAVVMVAEVAAEVKAVVVSAQNAANAAIVQIAQSEAKAEMPMDVQNVANAVKAVVQTVATPRVVQNVANAVVAMAVANAAAKPVTAPKVETSRARMNRATTMHRSSKRWMPMARKPPVLRVVKVAAAVAAEVNAAPHQLTTPSTKKASSMWPSRHRARQILQRNTVMHQQRATTARV
jgi:hypothetical protein